LWGGSANNGERLVSSYCTARSKNGGKQGSMEVHRFDEGLITRKKKLRFAVQISAVNSAGQGTIAQVSLKKY
jgi:hypothetical protein